MECFCGCGTKVSRRAIDANLLASRLALELLAWDKARVEGRLGDQAAELESLIARGENCYRRAILVVHGEGRRSAVAEGDEWMQESLDHRATRKDMTEGRSLFSKGKLRLDAHDYEHLDRAHPSQSFSRRGSPDQLERLARLHAEGVLSDEEFAAARDRVAGG